MVYRLERILLYTFVFLTILLIFVNVTNANGLSERKMERHAINLGVLDVCDSTLNIHKCDMTEQEQEQEQEEKEEKKKKISTPIGKIPEVPFKWNQTQAEIILKTQYNLNGAFFK